MAYINQMDPFPDNVDNIQTIKQLIESGIDPNKPYTEYRSTLLHRATLHDDYDMVKYLLDNGADPNVTNDVNDTPLHAAVLISTIDIVRCLVEYGTDIEHVDDDCFRPLHLAAYGGHMDIVQYLLNQGADKSALNMYNETAAQMARNNRKFDIAELIESYEFSPTKGVHD